MRLFLIILCSLFVVGVVQAQRTAAYRFEHLGVEDGLSQRTVNVILQDHEGYLWFGTDDGLNRYDGLRFEVYRHVLGDPQSLSNSRITALMEDRDRVLWVGTHNGLNRFDRRTETFAPVPLVVGAENCGTLVQSIVQDALGGIWIGTTQALCHLDPQTGALTRVPYVDAAPLENVYSVYSMTKAADGTIWVSSGGLPIGTACRLDLVEKTCQLEQVGFIRFIGVASTGTFMVREDGNTSELCRYADNALTCLFNLPGVGMTTTGSQNVVQPDPQRLWLATQTTGIMEADLKTGTTRSIAANEDDPFSLRGQVIRCFYQDRQGYIWIGTEEGVNRWVAPSPSRFAHYQRAPGTPPGLSSNRVNHLIEDRHGDVWVATNDGLNQINRRTGAITAYFREPLPEDLYPHVYPNAFWWVYEDQQGTLWVGGKRFGLFRFDRATERFLREDAFTMSLMGSDLDAPIYVPTIRFIGEDDAGTLWIGTGEGLASRDPATGAYTAYAADPNNPQGLPTPLVNVVYQDQNGTHWVGTDAGLCRLALDAGTFACHQHDPNDLRSLGANIVWTMTESPLTPGRLWVGTIGGGLCGLDLATETCTRFSTAEGLPNNTIYGLLTDASGTLWMSTNAGLARFHPLTHETTVYTAADGLHSDDFDLMAYGKARDGTLFFGGADGFNAFHPDSLYDSTYEPPVVITGFRAFDVPRQGLIATGDSLRLGHDENFFSFDFAALDFENPLKNRYEYRLAGYDEDWRTTDGARPAASYTGVPPGRYVFEVRGSNHDGVFNPEPARVYLRIVPAFWQTRWFRWSSAGFVLAALLLSLGWAYQRRIAALQREQAEARETQRLLAESRERERHRIARELHDGPMQRLYRVGHDLDHLAMHAEAPPSSVQAVRERVNTVATELREVLGSLRVPVIQHLGLGMALQSLVRRFQRQHPTIDVVLDLQTDGRALPEEVQHALYRVSQEALTNIGKHAEATTVRLRLESTDAETRLSVQDNGKGFARPARLLDLARAHHFGLIGATERMEVLGGRLAIETAPGAGTEVQAWVPHRRNHEEPGNA